MATATSPPTPQVPDLPPGTFATVGEAMAHARRLAPDPEAVPLIARNADGSVRIDAILKDTPTPSPVAAISRIEGPLPTLLDEQGRLIPDTPEVRRERLRRMREAFAAIEADPATPEQVEAELEELREIDRERAARGARPLFEGV